MKKEKSKIISSLILPLTVLSIMWGVKGYEWINQVEFFKWGIYPLTKEGLIGILTAPFIHKDFNHIVSNSVPLFISLTFINYFYPKVALKVFAGIYLMTGLWVWIFARPSYHIGASGIIYGFVCFLFFSGVFRKDTPSMAISLLITFLYGSMVWGLLPVKVDMSWESHLMGSLAGIVFAFYYRNVDRKKEVYVWNDDDTDTEYLNYELEGEEKLQAPTEPPPSFQPPYFINYQYVEEKQKQKQKQNENEKQNERGE